MNSIKNARNVSKELKAVEKRLNDIDEQRKKDKEKFL